MAAGAHRKMRRGVSRLRIRLAPRRSGRIFRSAGRTISRQPCVLPRPSPPSWLPLLPSASPIFSMPTPTPSTPTPTPWWRWRTQRPPCPPSRGCARWNCRGPAASCARRPKPCAATAGPRPPSIPGSACARIVLRWPSRYWCSARTISRSPSTRSPAAISLPPSPRAIRSSPRPIRRIRPPASGWRNWRTAHWARPACRPLPCNCFITSTMRWV